MTIDSPITIAYETSIKVRRTGPVGRLLGWIGTHPVVAGLICGVLVVATAAGQALEGVQTEPTVAAILALLVIGTWMVLFFVMRGFFLDQSYAHQPVLRELTITDDKATWLENKALHLEIVNPVLRVLSTDVPDEARVEGSSVPWPIWVVIEDPESDRSLVLETRDSALKAAQMERATPEEINAAVERLPRALLLPILTALDKQ